MRHFKGRIIKPESLFIDHVAIDLQEAEAGIPAHGQLELPVGATLKVGETYRLELPDGRAGQIRMKSFNDVSTVGEFEVVGSLQ